MVLDPRIIREVERILSAKGFGNPRSALVYNGPPITKDIQYPAQCGRCYEPLMQTPDGAYCMRCSTSDEDFGGGRPFYYEGG